MKVPDWRNLVLNEGLIPESIPDDSRIALWLPGSREGGFQHWKRVSNVARAEVTGRVAIGATPAMLIQARQPVGGILGKLFGRRSVPEDRAWLLPNGKSAEQWGERQTDLILVWAEDESTPLHESGIKSQWPESKECHK